MGLVEVTIIDESLLIYPKRLSIKWEPVIDRF